MWLLLLLLTAPEIFVLAENSAEEIKDGELSRKILGQSVVTSVSVVMDIGNGTKTIFTDPLGKPVEKPPSSSELASPINLLNPDRYEFYTFDDNGNLVRRLMSLDEIKGIIATGDSDGLEYDSALSEAYIPEKRVNDVLNNVQNVLKEEMEIHSTKLESFPPLDTPDVSDSWNMILPAVFGNSGAVITPEKPHLHVTPDTIMIEPTDQNQSTPRSTPILNTFTKIQSATLTSISTPSKTTESSTELITDSREGGITLPQITDVTTKEYIPLSTIPAHSDKGTTNQEIDTTVKTTVLPLKSEYVKIDQVVSSTENSIYEKVTELVTRSNQTSFGTVTITPLKTSSASELSTITESQTTNLPELTIQSVESSINCTSVKNESEGTTVAPMLDEVNSILSQLLSTPYVNGLSEDITDTTSQLVIENKENVNDTDKITTQITIPTDRFETTSYFTEVSTLKNNQNKKVDISETSSTVEYFTTETHLPEISNQNNSFTNNFNESITTTTSPIVDSTTETFPTEYDIKTSLSTEKVDIRPSVENKTNLVFSEIPIKSTKLENTKEIIKDDQHIVLSTPTNQDNLHTTTILVPLTIIDSSTITSNDLNETTIRVPLIDPSESKTNTIKPSVGIVINETQNENSNESMNNDATSVTSSTQIYDESKKITNSNLVKENNNTFDPSSILTEKISLVTEKINTVTQNIQETKITETLSVVSETESIKREPNWTLVPTIAPHSGGTLGTLPSTSESYPDVLDPPEPINLKAEPLSGFSLEESTSSLDKDISQFSQLYNELAFEFWKTTTSSLSHARSLVLSPFGTISLLAMIFLGARGSTSAEMNEILKLDDMISFNPHLILKNVGESVLFDDKDSGVVTSAFIKELFMCRLKGKFLPFYKERVRAFYDGFAEEVNFKEIGDIIRRRTNLQVKKHSDGRIAEFLTDMSVVGRPPLVGLGVNIFQTNCSSAFSEGRDGEMHFTVLPTIRQRRLVPIPAVLYKFGFLAGYEPSLDATAVSIGGKNQTMSTIFVMPGQQGTPAPGDGLSRLEKSLVESSFKKGAWSRLLRSLIPRSELEVQIPRIVHRSVVNTTESLKKMGFLELFKKGQADLVGMNGISNELYMSDMIQINHFTTCGERRTEHHSELYPNSIGRSQRSLEDLSFSSFEDPLHLSYLKLPLPLRPRQARKPETPRLKFDRPFLYFVRHNPTGLILHIGRFNPRLLP